MRSSRAPWAGNSRKSSLDGLLYVWKYLVEFVMQPQVVVVAAAVLLPVATLDLRKERPWLTSMIPATQIRRQDTRAAE